MILKKRVYGSKMSRMSTCRCHYLNTLRKCWEIMMMKQFSSPNGQEAKWIFFAGTVKCLVTKASLQWPYNEHHWWCLSFVKILEFIYIQKDQLKETRFLDSRFENIKSPVPGKRTFHEFSPISECKVVVKRHSEDK